MHQSTALTPAFATGISTTVPKHVHVARTTHTIIEPDPLLSFGFLETRFGLEMSEYLPPEN